MDSKTDFAHEVSTPGVFIYPNKWSKLREYIKEPFAEFLGTCILVMFGAGVNCQVVLSSSPNVASTQRGDSLSTNFGWAVGIAMGVWLSGGISGGHINPAVTLTMAVFRGFPWRKVPIFILAQTLGGIVGAALVYVNYFHAIDLFEGPGVRTLKTAGLFSTFALDYMTNGSAFFNEFLGTALLVLAIFAINDKKNMPIPNGLVPLALFLALLGISACFGMQTGFAINPARDFGPRVLTAMVGYGKEVFTYRNAYWVWCPIFGPILGALCGAAIYDVFLYTGGDSIVNRSFRRSGADLPSPI